MECPKCKAVEGIVGAKKFRMKEYDASLYTFYCTSCENRWTRRVYWRSRDRSWKVGVEFLSENDFRDKYPPPKSNIERSKRDPSFYFKRESFQAIESTFYGKPCHYYTPEDDPKVICDFVKEWIEEPMTFSMAILKPENFAMRFLFENPKHEVVVGMKEFLVYDPEAKRFCAGRFEVKPFPKVDFSPIWTMEFDTDKWKE